MEDTKDMETENVMTLGDIFKVIFKRIWWVLGATVLCALILLLITELWYNKKEQYYTISYDIVYPDVASGKYPDGSDLIVSDSISYSTLNDIKEGKYSEKDPNEFKGIDVREMYTEDDISVTDRLVKSDGDSAKISCTLTVKARYFTSASQARAFLRTVAAYPVNRTNSVMADKAYNANLSAYASASTYEEKLDALSAQKSYLESEYTKLKGYGEKADEGIASLRNIFTSAQLNDLEAHILAGRYVYDPVTYKAEADAQKASLGLQIADNENTIAALREEQKKASAGSAVVDDHYDERIASLTATNAGYRNRISAIDETLAAIEKYTSEEDTAEKAAKQAFDTRLYDYYEQLSKATQTLKSVSISVYGDNSRTVFSGNKLEKEGGLHWALSLILGALLGLVVSAIVVYFVGAPGYKREKLAAAQGGEPAAPKAEKGAEGGEAVPEVLPETDGEKE
ncbi:MAG: hypothetical protein NC131_04035 [Roseburia sp.]|nr:hypothetical protein [Roseburia sp.]